MLSKACQVLKRYPSKNGTLPRRGLCQFGEPLQNRFSICRCGIRHPMRNLYRPFQSHAIYLLRGQSSLKVHARYRCRDEAGAVQPHLRAGDSQRGCLPVSVLGVKVENRDETRHQIPTHRLSAQVRGGFRGEYREPCPRIATLRRLPE